MGYLSNCVLALSVFVAGVTALISFCNPVVQNVHTSNPRVTAYKDLYYMVDSIFDNQGNAYRIRVSDDFQNWGRVSYAFPANSMPPHIGSLFETSQIVVINDSTFRLYFTGYNWKLETYTVFVATASNIEGPYTVVDEPLVYDPEAYATDPYVFDDNGQLYLLWQTGNIAINIIKLAKNGLSVTGEKRVLIQGETLSRASMIKSESSYFLYYNNYTSDREPMNNGMAARSKTVLGPYELMDHYLDLTGSGFVDTVIGNVVKDRNNTDTIFYTAKSGGIFYGADNAMAMSLVYTVDGWPTLYSPPSTYCKY